VKKKKIVVAIMLAGVSCAVFATDARVETMGRTDRFFKDETSIHRNAADLGLYDKIMYGSYGFIDSTSNSSYKGIVPKLPMFGGAVSMGQKEGSSSKFAIGATFNRVDSALNYVMFNVKDLGLDYKGLKSSTNQGERPVVFAGNSIPDDRGYASDKSMSLVGKVDLMLAQTFSNGTTIGLGGYLAFQDSSADRSSNNYRNRFVRGNIGVNTPIGDNTALEASVGLSALDLRGYISRAIGESQWYDAAKNDLGMHVDVRLFSDISSISGAFVPHIQANVVQYDCGREHLLDFNAGLGLNLNIDRGFFWAGLEGLYNKKSRAITNAMAVNGGDSIFYYGKKDLIGGKIAFGIERNVLTDWFIIRVGGAKLLAKETRADGKDGSNWVENPDADHVSLGMGVNIEDRLKIDFTVVNNLPYTFTNLFGSGSSPYVMSRVSAVFAF